MYDIAIIGAGVTGAMIARTLAKYDLNIVVLEKNNDVGGETSSANSAIVHSGYDPVPNTKKAKLNVLGNKLYDSVCEELDVHFKRIGSMTLAFSAEEVEKLKELQQRASLNGVETKLLNREETLALEPKVTDEVVGSLLAPTAGIINPFGLVVSAMENAIDNGVTLKLNYKVNSVEKIGDKFVINNELETKLVLNCSGVYSQVVSELVNPKSFDITPRKGEYVLLNHFKYPFVNHTLFTLPSDKGKGVLISPTTAGNYLIGPSAEATDYEDKSTDKATLNSIRQQANRMIKNIPYHETIRTFAGLRATPSTHDFVIEESETKGFINVAGIESPGLASAPAIALEAEKLVCGILNPSKKVSYNPCVRKHVRLKELSWEEKAKLFATNASYGRIVCKCEQISEGEILDELSRSCAPHSVAGLKRRLRVGFGKCQGGMCQTDAVALLAKYYGLDEKEVMYDNDGSYILLKETKEVM